MNWRKHSMLIKIFLVGMVATLVYKYMQSRARHEELIPPQASETDRPLANGRMEFWQADSRLDTPIRTAGNGPEAESLANEIYNALEESSDMHVFCMINKKNYMVLIRSSAAFDSAHVWETVRQAVVEVAEGVPTIGIGVRDSKKYNIVIVGGPDPEPILVKDSGPFTLYPYFYRAQNLAEDR